ncbi:hypothetical protein F0P96_10370 [Hymenobacter busanensis]|uniref:Uncharacterized protein n=1 Tax=Hymenobacter busanensis TaxID=2607656 RepID=A0A7L4ZYN8_9BACT|nr:hypothetical protein [Hymenobacter busanensis]KAA9333365.1 hypothetical protein F0P96_10370 [Hymenobacter busanensis]QHJ07956.1 hypothetical protein GUY19_11940 [Hymenobacter busanensis]
MPKALKTPEEKAVFRYRVEQVKPRLKRYAALLVTSQHPEISAERVYNVLRTPVRCYDDEVLNALEELANLKVAA